MVTPLIQRPTMTGLGGLLEHKTRSLQNRDTQFLRFHDLGAHAAADPVAVDNQAGTHC